MNDQLIKLTIRFVLAMEKIAAAKEEYNCLMTKGMELRQKEYDRHDRENAEFIARYEKEEERKSRVDAANKIAQDLSIENALVSREGLKARSTPDDRILNAINTLTKILQGYKREG